MGSYEEETEKLLNRYHIPMMVYAFAREVMI